MSGNNQPLNRRTVLKTLGISATSLAATIETTKTVKADESVPHESLRGTNDNPIPTDQIDRIRGQFVEKQLSGMAKSKLAFLETNETFLDDQILGYNILINRNGIPREQYVTRGSRTVKEPETVDSATAVETRLHQKADDLLAEAVTGQRSSADSVSTRADYDFDWSNWTEYGSTDVYHEFERDPEYDTRPGAVEFVNEVRRSPDDPRMAARSKVRMEPGRQICNDGFDEYCTPTVQTGWTNRSATVNMDWDQIVNETPTEELIVGTDPEGQVNDVTKTREASIDLELSRDPNLSVGYSSSVTLPGAELVDKTTKMTGRSEHEFSVNTPDSNSSKNNAVFEVGSAAKYQTSCGDLTRSRILDIDIDLAWGLDLSGWVNKTTNGKTFYYYTYC